MSGWDVESCLLLFDGASLPIAPFSGGRSEAGLRKLTKYYVPEKLYFTY